MALHDTAAVIGVTEACKYNDHGMCNNPRCACTCHTQAAEAEVGRVSPATPDNNLTKACPKCGAKRPFNETFCRIDGAKLSSLQCKICGAVMDAGDKFCFACGGEIGAADKAIASMTKEELINAVGQVRAEQTVADYDTTVLTSLQRELEGQVEQENVNDSAKVVDKPMGTQGSFTLVSKPNPNKLRTARVDRSATGEPVSEGGKRQTGLVRRIPVKP